jgi:hypothetical protein
MLGAALFMGAGLSVGQSDDGLQFGGTFEQFFASSGFGDTYKSRDRWTMLSLNATSGKWKAQASYWYYPFCYWYELDDSGITYQDGNLRAQIGRFRIPVGQSDWGDQWYEGFVQLPIIEYSRYDGAQPLERTSVGMQAEDTFGAHTIKVAATSANPEYNRILPGHINRYSGRYSFYEGRAILGFSGFFDTDREEAFKANMISADFRYTMPNWMIRGEHIWYHCDNQKEDVWFVDVSHRPKGWTDVTVVGRFEVAHISGPFTSNVQAWTLGTRIRMPLNFVFQANYTGGPDMNRVFFGGGWALGLYTSIDFKF